MVVQDIWKWRRSIDHNTTFYCSAIVSIALSRTTFALLSRRSRQRERLSALELSICLSVCLSPKCKKTRFSQKKSNLELRCLLTTDRKLCKLNWAFQRTHYWIPTIQDGWDTPSWKSTWRHFFLPRWSDLDKISQTDTEWHVDCGDVWKWKPYVAVQYGRPRTFGRIQWHVIRQPRVTLQGAATWWIHCHDSRAACHTTGCSHLTKSMSWSCHIAGCKNSIWHIENRFSPYFIFFCF